MAADPRILVIRRRYLGDIVLLGPVFRNLRAHWPGARISALVEPAFADILALNPDVNDAMLLPRRLVAWPKFLRAIRAARFTHVLDLDNTERTALVARASGAPFRLALHHGNHRVKLRAAYTQVVHDPAEQHEHRPIYDYYLLSVSAAGVPITSRQVQLVPRAADLAEMRAFVGPERALLVHPGSRSAARLWPAERFAAVCDRVQTELGVRVILVGGPGEPTLLSQIRQHARHELAGFDAPPSIPRFAALVQCCALLLCHDSGPMHLAAAVGTPVVALHGSQNTRLFGPAGPGHTLLQPSLPCGIACVAPGECVREDSYRSFCVRRLGADEVFAAVRSQLGTRS